MSDPFSPMLFASDNSMEHTGAESRMQVSPELLLGSLPIRRLPVQIHTVISISLTLFQYGRNLANAGTKTQG